MGGMSDRRLPPPVDPLLARLERLEQTRQPAVARQAPVGRQARRKRPARIAKLGALALSCATTAGLAYLFADINTTQAANQALAALPSAVPVATTPSTVLAATTVDSATTVPVATTPTTITPTTIAVPVLQAFNGTLIDTLYGPVQVQLQFTNGAISEVAVVAYPDGDSNSVRINARALPTLRTEVLAAQGAQIDTVSGATYTSHAYKKSLQSAIDEGRAAGITAIA